MLLDDPSMKMSEQECLTCLNITTFMCDEKKKKKDALMIGWIAHRGRFFFLSFCVTSMENCQVSQSGGLQVTGEAGI